MTNILESFKDARSVVNATLNQWGYEIRSSGTKDVNLPSSASLDNSSGYWDLNANSGITNKPPRWILHIEDVGGQLVTDFAKDSAGQVLRGASSIGYINNREGKASVMMFRILPAFKSGPSNFNFPKDWEWLLTVAFNEPLPAGTSGELLTNFSPSNSTVDYKGNNNQTATSFSISVLGLIKSKAILNNSVQVGGQTVNYDDATDSIERFLSQGSASVKVCDPSSAKDLKDLAATIENKINASISAISSKPITINPAKHLLGIDDSVYAQINASFLVGKKHFIFYGPPGTGKTTLAEHIAEQIADEDDSFIELTASSSWSSQDLVGGYQPVGNGEIAFIPGIMLKNFDKPIIIDEMNRCPIDKVIGPLFSVLSGQSSSLPYRTDISNPDSESYKILPSPVSKTAANEFAPGPKWSMICTLNQVDKTQLGQLSYALSRRFAWIRIGVPEDLNRFIVDIFEQLGYLSTPKDYTLPNPIADMWQEVNNLRELGGAPMIDFLRLAKALKPDLELQSSPDGNSAMQKVFVDCFSVTVTPLLDGIRELDAKELTEKLSSAWHLEEKYKKQLTIIVRDLAI